MLALPTNHDPRPAAPPVAPTGRDAALLRSRRLALCRIDPGEKKPTYPAWPTRSAEPAEFRPGELVGILGGPLSDCGRPGHALVIIDLDAADAVRLADEYLPPTCMVEGRPGKPRSHRYYLVPFDTIPAWAESKAEQAAAAAKAATGHPGPFKKQLSHRETKSCVIDFIGTGGQCVCPPSLHPSGERREWERGEPGDPAVVPFVDLWDSVGLLASACGAAIPKTQPFEVRATAAPSVVKRAAKYLAGIPGAVTHLGGSKVTFWAARCMVRGFLLKEADALRLLLDEYNPRCEPPWTEKELRHKVEDAARLPFGKEDGWLLNANGDHHANGNGSKATGKSAELVGAIRGQAAMPDRLTNFEMIDGCAGGRAGESEQKARKVRAGRSAAAVRKDLSALSGDWPRRVGRALFVSDGDRGPLWLTKPEDVFGWAQSLFPPVDRNAIHWAERSAGMLSRSEFVAYLRQQAVRYESVEAAPHEPPIDGHYYIHPPTAGGDGKALAGLLSRFSPYSEDDALLVRAFFLTLFWGGPYGQRPAFLFTGPDRDEQMGRGVGKTTLVRLGSRLVGGTFDVRPSENWDDVMKRLLSDTACSTQRVILIDNVKTHRFSWSDVEALITAARINGRKLFVGDGARPNTFVVAITLNGASLSKDLAQRCVIVKLERPTYAGSWEEQTAEYIDRHRWAIVGDILAELRRPAVRLGTFSRWGLWERDILGRLPDPQRLQALIAERREAVDDDSEEADLVREAIKDELLERGHGDPDGCAVRIPAKVMAEVVNGALGERLSTTAVATKLKAMGGVIPELIKRVYLGRRVWAWFGKNHRGAEAENLGERACPTGRRW